MKPGQVVQVGDYGIRHDRIRVTDDGRKQMVTAEITVLRDGAELTKMYPARWFFRKHEDQPTTEVAIRRTLAEDLYIVMPQFEAGRAVGEHRDHGDAARQLVVAWLWRACTRHAHRASCPRPRSPLPPPCAGRGARPQPHR